MNSPKTSPFPGPGWTQWPGTYPNVVPGSEIMKAAFHTPNAKAVGQADFEFAQFYGKHGSADIFAGKELATFGSREKALAAAQALKGAHGIVGVFADGTKQFDVRELLVGGGAPSDKRNPGWVDQRPVPDILKPLHAVEKEQWKGSTYNLVSRLAAVSFTDNSLLGFVDGSKVVLRGD